jgi:hypothetical protein
MTMGWSASSSIIVALASIALPVLAEESWSPSSATTPRVVKAPVTDAARPTTTAVAAFPDVVPEHPAQPVDPALELLASDPYEAQLTARKIAANLYGEDAELDSPYAEQLRLANPYTDRLRARRPVADSARFDNPYSASLTLENPYSDSLRMENPYSTQRR